MLFANAVMLLVVAELSNVRNAWMPTVELRHVLSVAVAAADGNDNGEDNGEEDEKEEEDDDDDQEEDADTDADDMVVLSH